MTETEFKTLWASLSDAQKRRVRDKAQWEHMSLWAVCIQWPGIWSEI